jgi:hypothetical protein
LRVRYLIHHLWASSNRLLHNLSHLSLLLHPFWKTLSFGSCYRVMIVLTLHDDGSSSQQDAE